MTPECIHRIAEIVGSEHCRTSREDLHCYSYDASKRIFLPEAVALPDSTEQVSGLLRLANEERFPVIPRGAGSGMTGGALAVEGA